uniref:Uncharacterized protein n=1 Tax=Mycena chlorophos TaxID=658473 RepID=A0ABQ0MD65_MYCCL|nr:predicted protein [Mycena chlorophos]
MTPAPVPTLFDFSPYIYGNTRILHPGTIYTAPTLSNFAAASSVVVPSTFDSKSDGGGPSSTAVNVLLVMAIVVALAGTAGVVWICFRRRNRRTSPPRKPQSWEMRNPFAVKGVLMPRPNLIMHMGATEATQDALLQEVPNVWRVLGRPNVATHDADVDEAIPDYRQKTGY